MLSCSTYLGMTWRNCCWIIFCIVKALRHLAAGAVQVDLAVYVQERNISKVDWAMQSLKKAMRYLARTLPWGKFRSVEICGRDARFSSLYSHEPEPLST